MNDISSHFDKRKIEILEEMLKYWQIPPVYKLIKIHLSEACYVFDITSIRGFIFKEKSLMLDIRGDDSYFVIEFKNCIYIPDYFKESFINFWSNEDAVFSFSDEIFSPL